MILEIVGVLGPGLTSSLLFSSSEKEENSRKALLKSSVAETFLVEHLIV